MRRTCKLLAAVKPARHLEAGTPTGLTGLFTHPAPRSTLIYLYSSTLEKLAQLPSSSVYRQSTEALTRNRLQVINSVVPAGYEEWATKAKKTVAENPELFNAPEGGPPNPEGSHLKETFDGRSFVTARVDTEPDEINDEWGGEGQSALAMKRPRMGEDRIEWHPEPPLSTEQIEDVENRIGAGLIEEVIEVAEGELKLVQAMTQAKVWEDLEEKPVEGQWTYFERGTHTGKTQAPPQTK